MSSLQLKMQVNTATKSSNALDKFLSRLLSMPVWVKSYIYFNLRNNLKPAFHIDYLNSTKDEESIYNYVPAAAPAGIKLIQRKFNSNVISFELTNQEICLLKSCEHHKRLVDICAENNWSMVDVCCVIIDLIGKGYLEPIQNSYMANQIYYLAGKIRIGEYLLRMNKLSLDQIDRALVTQREIHKTVGEKVKLGEVLVNLGYVKESDKDSIIQLKINSSQPVNIVDDREQLQHEIQQLKSTIETLKFENESLKQDMVFYQDELIEKSNVIARLEQKKKEPNKFSALLNRLLCHN